jgi:hypothetical protein
MNKRYRAIVLVLVLAMLAAFSALPVVAQEAREGPPACPLTYGTDAIVLNIQAWEVGLIRSDRDLAAATLGPGAAVVPAGTYDVVLAAWDRHNPGDATQLNEQFALFGLDGSGEVVFASGSTPDIQDGERLVIATVDVGVEIAGFTQAKAVHAAHRNTESPNSLWPLCAAFIPVQEDAGSITVRKVAQEDPTRLFAFGLDRVESSPVEVLGDGEDSHTWSELGAGTFALTETVPEGWQLSGVTCESDDEGPAATVAVAAGVSITLEDAEDVTCTFVNTKTTIPTIPPTPSPDPVVIGDRVWEDVNADGYQADFEPGLPGVTVNLLNGVGSVVATTVTGPAGDYLFTGIPAGTYAVQVVLAAGYEIGLANPVGQITLAAGQSDLTKDFGAFRSPGVLPQVITTTTQAPVTQETLPFTGVSTAGSGGVAVALILIGGLVLLVADSRRRYDPLHRSN